MVIYSTDWYDAAKALLKDNPELAEEIEAKVREALAAKNEK